MRGHRFIRCAGLAFAALLVPALAWSQPPVESGPIAIVVPADSPVQRLDAESLALIYRRKKLLWDHGRRVVPVNLPADHALRLRFSRAVLGATPESLEAYWNQQYFQGLLPPHVLASEAAVGRFVAGTANAVGYLPACALPAGLRAVLLIDADNRVLPPDAAIDLACPSPP